MTNPLKAKNLYLPQREKNTAVFLNYSPKKLYFSSK